MVRIRLQIAGKKKVPIYRVVVTDSRNKREGKALEILGYYDPRGKQGLHLKVDRVQEWIKKGAQPTDRVKSILKIYNREKTLDTQGGRK